jgi:hypothetical protein
VRKAATFLEQLTDGMMHKIRGMVAAAATVLLLAGCEGGANKNIRILDGSSSSQGEPQPIRTLSAEEIFSTLNGRTFQYTRAESTGLITFNSDGTSTIQDDLKGSQTGTWSANGGELCESVAGQPSKCGTFKSTGDAYFAGKDRFVEMKLN